MSLIRRGKAGFTLVEFILAAAMFSFFLVIITSIILLIYRLHESGLTTRRTQQSARLLIEKIERLARGSAVVHVTSNAITGERVVCFYPPPIAEGDFVLAPDPGRANPFQVIRFLPSQNAATNGRLQQGTANPNRPCSWASVGNSFLLSDEDVNVIALDTDPVDPTSANRTLSITLKIASLNQTANPDLYNGNECQVGFFAGHQFCNITTVATSVSLRGEAQP